MLLFTLLVRIQSAGDFLYDLAIISLVIYDRYIQLADPYGSTGLTVWSTNVNRFSLGTVGKLVTCQRLVVSTHASKRCLTMGRDSVLDIDDDGKHAVMDWWQSLLVQPALCMLSAHNAPENTIISVAGVVGAVTLESKMVGCVSRLLTTIHLVDATGKFDVRTWNRAPHTFDAYIDRPATIKRVRVSSFAGEKLAELLEGDGSSIVSIFPGSEVLAAWWDKQD